MPRHPQSPEAAAHFQRAATGDRALSHVEFAVGGKVVKLRDVAGSVWAARVLDEFAHGMYGLTALTFAPGDVAVDIGGHIGGVSVILATLHPEIRIVTFEPSSSNFAMLQANLAANGITTVTPVQQAVMGRRGELTLTWTVHDTAAATIGLSDAARAGRESGGWSSETVPCVTLDDVFADHTITRCAWLKLDCEGAEWDIVAGTRVLERIDRMAMELHLPISRKAEGEQPVAEDFAKLVNRVAQPPAIVVSSTVWILDR